MKDSEEWNGAVKGLGGSVLQSWEWGEFRRHHGWRPMRLLGEAGAAQVLLRSVPGLGAIAYAPHGPLAEGSLEAVIEAVSERAKDEGAHLIDVEPRISEGEFPAGSGFEKIESIQPRCTLVLDVLEDGEKQLAAFPKDTRYGVRRAGREGVEAGPTENLDEDLESFMGLHEETAERQSFAVRPREYYRRLMRELPSRLIVAKREGELMAGAVILTFGEEAFYLYGASTRQGDNLYASYLAQSEALSAAREAGAKRYDMYGVPCAPTEDHPLWGVYKFKKKFGGREEQYAGTHEKRLRPLQAGIFKAGMSGYAALQKLRGRGSGPVSD
ncbi:MAG: peptidoglycan bridge formation glycyltransferase FemA/FemB family protein [Rubrobacter sp.]|nr:peptidoglycan bridge formation glycyltransferase FemA/FemB family protein [Rubrobacter sp.]